MKLCQIPLEIPEMNQLFTDMDIRSLDKVDIEMFCALVNYWMSTKTNKVNHLNNNGNLNNQGNIRSQYEGFGSESSSSSSQYIDENLLESLNQINLRKDDFIKCCLQLGGEEYSNRKYNNNGNHVGLLPFCDVWIALRHIGIKTNLENDIKQFILKYVTSKLSIQNNDDLLVEPMLLVQATLKYLSTINNNENDGNNGKFQNQNQNQKSNIDFQHEMGNQQLYLCALAWQKATQYNDGGQSFKQQLLGRSDMNEILARGGLKLRASEIHSLWYELWHRSQIIKQDFDQGSSSYNHRPSSSPSSRQSFNELMSTASVMKYHDINDVFQHLLSSLSKYNNRGNRGGEEDGRLNDQYEQLRQMGQHTSKHSSSESLFHNISPSLQQQDHPTRQQPLKTSSQLSSQDINSQRQSHRKCFNNVNSSFDAPFATGLSYNEKEIPPEIPPRREEAGQRQVQSSYSNHPQYANTNSILKDDSCRDGGRYNNHTREKGNYQEQRFEPTQGYNRRVAPPPPPPPQQQRFYQERDQFHQESLYTDKYSPHSLPQRPAAGMREDEHIGKESRSDPNRANSLGSLPSQRTYPNMPSHFDGMKQQSVYDGRGVLAFQEEDDGNVPAIISYLRNIARQHRDRLDHIFPEVVSLTCVCLYLKKTFLYLYMFVYCMYVKFYYY